MPTRATAALLRSASSTSPRSSLRTSTYVRAEAPATATATATATASVSRTRKLTVPAPMPAKPASPLLAAPSSLRRLAQRVADSTHRLDQARPAALLRLAAQVADVDVERVGAEAEVVA